MKYLNAVKLSSEIFVLLRCYDSESVHGLSQIKSLRFWGRLSLSYCQRVQSNTL